MNLEEILSDIATNPDNAKVTELINQAINEYNSQVNRAERAELESERHRVNAENSRKAYLDAFSGINDKDKGTIDEDENSDEENAVEEWRKEFEDAEQIALYIMEEDNIYANKEN